MKEDSHSDSQLDKEFYSYDPLNSFINHYRNEPFFDLQFDELKSFLFYYDLDQILLSEDFYKASKKMKIWDSDIFTRNCYLAIIPMSSTRSDSINSINYSYFLIGQLNKQDGSIELFTDEGDPCHPFYCISEIECYYDTCDFISTQECDPQFDDASVSEKSDSKMDSIFESFDEINNDFGPSDFLVGEYR